MVGDALTPDLQQARSVRNSDPVRLFIGIKIAPDLADILADFAYPLNDPSVRLIPVADLHLTLVPPWREIDLPGTILRLRDAVQHVDSFILHFEYLRYAPTPAMPLFLWAGCAATEELVSLRGLLLSAFDAADEGPFQPHVTLARLGKESGHIAHGVPMDRRLSLSQMVRRIELFRSPQQQGRGYEVVASVPLREKKVADDDNCLRSVAR